SCVHFPLHSLGERYSEIKQELLDKLQSSDIYQVRRRYKLDFLEIANPCQDWIRSRKILLINGA
ncbi:MAG: hypothetical protein KTM48_02490, partial [Wolbachia endosymbiont of Pissodes strobi]|nr:hypothetical protein [Wolbachia endosymbiont of Pissodes strobi]